MRCETRPFMGLVVPRRVRIHRSEGWLLGFVHCYCSDPQTAFWGFCVRPIRVWPKHLLGQIFCINTVVWISMNKTCTLRKDQCGNIMQDSSLCDLWAHSPHWTFLIRARRSAREWEWTLMFFRLKATFESNRVCLVNSLPTYNNRSFKQHIVWTRGCPCSCVICSTSALKVAWCMSIQAGLLQHCVYFYHSTSMWARCAAVMWPATRASRVRVALSLSTAIPQLKWLPTFTWGKRIQNFSAECDFGQGGSYLKILVHLMWSWRNEQINPCFSPSQKTARDKQSFQTSFG